MIVSKIFKTGFAVAALVALAACGGGDDDASGGGSGGSAVNRELAEEGIDFDASTMDATSFDVVAGGSPPAADPGTADAGIDMVSGDDPSRPTTDTDDEPSQEPVDEQ